MMMGWDSAGRGDEETYQVLQGDNRKRDRETEGGRELKPMLTKQRGGAGSSENWNILFSQKIPNALH